MKNLDVRQFTGKTVVVTGHFGCGKTNFSVNLASALSEYTDVYLADYDNVNPYFRALDAKDSLTSKNVKVIASVFANTNVDIPSVPPDILGALNAVSAGSSVVLDVGGDMLGAVSLGSLHEKIISAPHAVIYVFNAYRPLTPTPQDAFKVLREIEDACGLKISYLVNNSNIGEDTTVKDIEATEPYAKELSRIAGVPLLCSSFMTDATPDVTGCVFKMKNYTKRIF